MKVDLIIPVYRPKETFCLLLQNLQKQTFLIHRLLILNTEEALWNEAVKKYPIVESLDALPFSYDLLHIRKVDFDHGGTRKYGAMQSDADIVIFMTQDAVPADNRLVESLVKGLKPGKEGIPAVSYAKQLPNKDCRIIERYTRQFNYPDQSRKKGKKDIESLGIKTFFCSDVCAAYRKDIFEKLNGFEEPVIFNEDMLFAAKAVEAGYLITYAADARVVHSHNYSMRQQFARNFDLAVSQKQHPEIFSHISSEAEGMKLVKSTIRYLCSIGKPWLVFELFAQSIAKYAGYYTGKRYERLGRKRILKYTMNRDYWHKIWFGEEV